MAKQHRITKELRRKLKRPLGKVIEGEHPSLNDVSLLLAESTMVCSVGDATTENLVKLGVVPAIQIVDGKEKRKKRRLPSKAHKTTLRASNPAGTITKESMEAIKRAFQLPQPVRILVDGEEDLLTIPLVQMSPEGSTIFYGQPNKGLVAVKVNKRMKEKVKYILKEIGVDTKSYG